MKKIRILAMLLTFALLFIAGCGGVNAKLKLESSQKTVSDYFYNYLSEAAFIQSKGLQKLDAQSSSYNNYSIWTSQINEGQLIFMNVVSAMDFCLGLADETIASDTTQKIYEYSSTYAEELNITTKFYVVVDKEKSKSVYTAKLYSAELSASDLDAILNEPIQTNKLTISRDKSEGIYEFSGTENNVNGTFSYNQKQLKISIEYKTYWLTSEGIFNTTIDVCNYKNGVMGARIITSTTSNGVKSHAMYEFLSKDFYKSAKIGTIKDARLYQNLTSIAEEKLGVENGGDDYGFKIIYDNQSDLNPTTIETLEYGIFPSN